MLSESSNLRLLDKRISELNLERRVDLAFDFDELVVPIHLTREITTKIFSKPVDIKLLDKLGSCSFDGIKYLGELISGYNFEDYKKIRDKTAKGTPWTLGFDDLLEELQNKYSVIFISSGVKDICEAKLKEINFNHKNIIGDELKIEDNKIVGYNLIISDELKGYIIRKLKKDYKVLAIGHSLGDKTMLDNADMSISVNSQIPNLAEYDVKSSKELLGVIMRQI